MTSKRALLHPINQRDLPIDWQLIPIGDALIDSQYGTNAPSVPNGDIDLIGMKDIASGIVCTKNLVRTKLNNQEREKYLLHKGDILINRTNSYDLVGKVGLYDSAQPAVFASYLVRLVVNRNVVNPDYLNYWLNGYIAQKTIKRIATRAISQANINPTEFKKHCFVPLPPLDEQQRIAEVLNAFGKAIELIGHLIDAKQKQRKGFMQQLLSSKRRFPGFTKPWQEFRLGDIFERVTRKNDVGCDLVLTASGERGLIDQKDYFNRSVSSESLHGYYHIKKGEFAYNRSAMRGYPYGSIKRLDAYPKGVLSTLYLCFSLSGEDQCSDFFVHDFEAGILNRQLRKIAQVGARAHGLLNVTAGDFFKLRLLVPDRDEQIKIAAFLNACNSEITLLRQQLDAFKEQKKGLMQQLLTGKVRVKPAKEAVA
ncbi:MAG: restriction endonuclease subunit S [Candidatus Thiodiazotropha sp.]